MTPDQYILLQIYATNKVYMTRILEMVCAAKEVQETGQEATGLLGAAVLADAEQLVDSLVESLKNNTPEDIEFGAIHGLSDDRLKAWFDKAVYEVFTKDGEREK